mmetsp:Transcript_26321/g.54278  ORF Transcript_26321/g.54278 Transcript_26321/m.54278 type:complete len:93 (-) Transcript_26321:272-550(-)
MIALNEVAIPPQPMAKIQLHEPNSVKASKEENSREDSPAQLAVKKYKNGFHTFGRKASSIESKATNTPATVFAFSLIQSISWNGRLTLEIPN